MDYFPGLKKIFLHKTQKMEVGALTRFPSMTFCFFSSIARLRLPNSLPRGHEDEWIDPFSLHARGLAVANFLWQKEARTDESVAAESTKSRSVLNLGFHEGLYNKRQWQFGEL